MKLRALQAVAVVAATGSCFLLPQEATLTVEADWNLDDPKGLAGIEIDIGGAILPERLLTAADLVADTQFVVPDAGTATVTARLVQDGRTVAGGTREWRLVPEFHWTLGIVRTLHPYGEDVCGFLGCHLIWRFPVVEDAASYEHEALWLILGRRYSGCRDGASSMAPCPPDWRADLPT